MLTTAGVTFSAISEIAEEESGRSARDVAGRAMDTIARTSAHVALESTGRSRDMCTFNITLLILASSGKNGEV
jgi:hypothetical protein